MGAEDQRKGALDGLDAAEAKEILTRLLGDHPDLQPEAERLAGDLLRSADPEAIAGNLELGLGLLDVDDAYRRSGPQRGDGYLDPSEAAWELIEDEFEPFMEDMRRRARQGELEAAGLVAEGMLLALYRCRDELQDDSLLTLAEDFPETQADHFLYTLRELGGRLPADAVELMPKWSDLLQRGGRLQR